MSAPLLEHAVFSKMHFDRNGLILAMRDEVPVGFVHAGFGPSDDGNKLDRSLGTTHMMMLRAGHEDLSLADDLLAASEEYLRSQGASVIYAGGIKPLNSFYLGLYGGSEIPGVLQSNTMLSEACIRAGYSQSAQVSIPAVRSDSLPAVGIAESSPAATSGFLDGNARPGRRQLVGCLRVGHPVA